jgi:hypothetical protein
MWEYDVKVSGTDYLVVIAHDHAVQSVSRVIQVEGIDRQARKLLRHRAASHLSREASKAIRAARVIERESMDIEARAAAAGTKA